ncbi:MAG TPA: TlyA family RNA methyltransferase [Thermoanaerobaculia bacterium]|nr:TlyA family RNA methyltransferase [Thermoanaerobaculia bacterium]
MIDDQGEKVIASPDHKSQITNHKSVLKTRLDLLLVSRGLAPTREKAQAMILSGRVEVEGRRVEKAGTPVDSAAAVQVLGPPHPYVSRGGVKLAAALDAFGLDPRDLVCLDVGASTGGFTDCLLQRGARRVYAVDVGYGQLDAKLRDDPRVVAKERVNARHLSREDVPEPAALAVMDLSFISVRLVLPAVVPLLAPGAAVVVLVKPQFEAGRREVPKGGVVRSDAVQRRVVDEIGRFGSSLGWTALGSIPSPIRGARGNQEFLLGFKASG